MEVYRMTDITQRLRKGITLYSAVLENSDKHMDLLGEAADEIEHLRDLLAVAYQMAGVVGAPVKYLDAFAYQTGSLYTLLPVDLDEFDLPLGEKDE